MKEFIPQMEPSFGEEEKKAMAEYLDSGGWLMEFKQTKKFEEMICEFTGAKYCSVVNNGTVSLFIALKALGIGLGDEVVVPNYTMIATPNSVRMAGAKPVFVDVDEDSFCINVDKVEEKINERTKAVIQVSINGRAGRLAELEKLCKNKNIHLVEDAAQSLGSFYNGKHLGTIGEIGSFSFSVPKIITTGQGGALITNSEELYNRIQKIKDFGRIKGGMDIHDSFGWNFKFTDMQAVIGIEQMKKLSNRVKRKKEIFELYKKLLAKSKDVRVVDNPEETSPWFIEIQVDEPAKLYSFLKEANIGSRLFYPPINHQTIYGSGERFQVSEKISSRGLWLPSSSILTNSEIRNICNKILEFYK